MDGIAEATGFTDDRNRTVAAGNHLRKSAWLSLTWHEEHITACVNLTGQGLVVGYHSGYPAMVLILKPEEIILIASVTLSENNNLKVGII